VTRARALVGLALAAGAAVACAAAPARPAEPGAQPGPAAAAPAGDESFRARPPAPEPRRPFVPPVPRVSRLANGMELMVVERHGGGVVAAELLLRGGSAAFPDEPAVAVAIMARLSRAGTTTRSERDILDTMNQRFFELETSAGEAWVSYRVRGLAGSFDTALELMSDVALHPELPAPILDIERQRYLALVAHEAEDTGFIARRSLYASLLGAGHPYARALAPVGPAVARLTRDDLLRVWRELADPADATLIVAGEVDAAALAPRVEALFGAWKHDPSRPAHPPVPPAAPSPARLVVIDRPGAPQATVLFGAALPPIDAPAYVAALVARQLLGGMRSSAIDTELRDQLGALWGAGSRLVARRGASIHTWEGSVARDKVPAALAALAARARELHERGPSPSELATAKALLVRGLPRRLETAGGVVSAFSEVAGYGLPLDAVDTFQARVEAITAGDVRAAAPAPEAMKAVVVGDLGVLLGPLRALGWGPIEEHDAQGALKRTIGAGGP
jgi:zinc protease